MDNTTQYTLTDIIASDDACTHYGVSWSTETVNREPDGNASAKITATDNAQILAISDVTNFSANFPNADEILLGIVNGTSLRVMSQDVSRRNPKKSRAELRTMILNRLQGVRNAGVRTVVTKIVEKIVKVHSLPDGSTYAGDNETEFQAAYLAALVDMGLDPAKAREIATRQTL